MAQSSVLLWTKNTGRNGWEPPIQVGPDQSVEARNVLLYFDGLGTRRGGSVAVPTPGGTPAFLALLEYIPTTLAAAELWLADSSTPIKILRCAGGPSFTSETLVDPVVQSTAAAVALNGVTLNGKLYLAYASGVNRLHVFDPNFASADTVRRTGLRPGASPPAVTNTGSGSYPATLRYYRVRWLELLGGVVFVRRSEPTTSVSFTPSGFGTAAHITRPTAVGEGETHWWLEGSTDNVIFYIVAGVGIATTTYDDASNPSTWATTLNAAPPAGTYVPFPSVKCLGTTGTRLYGFGVNETVAGDSVAPKNGRLYFTPVLDTTDSDDTERISNTTTIQGWIDVSRSAGSVDRGCSPRPVNNVIYCFQDRGVYGFYPTESNITPYRRVVFSTAVGNLAQQAIVIAIDHLGHGACYFIDPVLGPYTVGGTFGLRWCGKDVADIWATVNRDATAPGCGEWYPDRSQIIWLVATNGSDTPNLGIALDPTKMRPDEDGDLRGGFTIYDGDWVKAFAIRCFSTTLASPRSAVRTPYTSFYNVSTAKLLRYDESVHRDDTTPFKSFVLSGAQTVQHQTVSLERVYIVATTGADVLIQQSLLRDTGDQPERVSEVNMTPVATETTALKKFADGALTGAWCFQVQLGDSAARDTQWQIFQWRARISMGAEL